jgi:hypothetical protein
MCDLGRFKDLSAGIQSLVVAVSIPIGGYWALTKYAETLEPQTALLNYQLKGRQLREIEVLNLSIQVSQAKLQDEPTKHLCASIEIANVGNREESIYWKDSKVMLERISVTKNGDLRLEPFNVQRVESGTAPSVGMRILPGGTDRLLLVAGADQPGLYRWHVRIKASQASQDEAKRQGIRGAHVTWDAMTYQVVE